MVGDGLQQHLNTENIVSNKGQLLQPTLPQRIASGHVPVSIYLVSRIKLRGKSSLRSVCGVAAQYKVTQMVYGTRFLRIVPGRAVGTFSTLFRNPDADSSNS